MANQAEKHIDTSSRTKSGMSPILRNVDKPIEKPEYQKPPNIHQVKIRPINNYKLGTSNLMYMKAVGSFNNPILNCLLFCQGKNRPSFLCDVFLT